MTSTGQFKAVHFFSSLVLASLVGAGAAQATSPADLAAQADKAYSARGFDAAGVKNAEQAATLFGQAAQAETANSLKAVYLGRQAEALYFVGYAAADRSTKISIHDQGYRVGDQVAQLFGLNDIRNVSDQVVTQLRQSLSAADQVALASGLYHRATNLGQWGSASGVTTSIGRWPELRANLELVNRLGQGSLFHFGANRVLGRAYFKIPSLMGGSVSTAERLLAEAVTKTAAPGQKFSVNGYNNIFYAEVLEYQGKKQEAIDLLNGFISADVTVLRPDAIPESKRAQQEAQDLLNSW
jgi:hypothetical protein